MLDFRCQNLVLMEYSAVKHVLLFGTFNRPPEY